MTTPATAEAPKHDLSRLDLEPAKLDFLSVKTQIVFATVLSTILIFTIFWPSLTIGFLHDDWLHLDYVARAVSKGDWSDFLANFHGNWGGSDLMLSYRPLISLSLLIDFLVYKTNALGFHITNLLLTSCCCLFVALIASELCGPFGNRMRAATAIWAALLFAAYPLHIESVAWVIGRVDLLCTLFYLASLYYFLRLKLIEEKAYIWLCVVCFGLSLLSKEMAVTLPAVATVFAFLIPDSANITSNQKPWAKFIRIPSPLEQRTLWLLWLTLGAFALIRMIFLGSAVGGYGADGAAGAILGLDTLFASFANKAALLKVVVPINEEILPISKRLMTIGFTTYIAAGVFAGLRCLATPLLTRYFIAFFLFGAITLLPTFQIWNIANNLSGARLFFLSSAPLALALAFAFVPSEDSIDKVSTKLIATAGVGFLAFTLVVFCTFCHSNMTAFTGAGEMLKKLREEVSTLYQQNADRKFVLLNLPSDFQGAPVLARPQYFKTMIKPPFSVIDASNNFDFEAQETNLPNEVAKDNKSPQQVYFSESDLKLHPLNSSTDSSANSGFNCSFNDMKDCKINPTATKITDGKQWFVFCKEQPQVVTQISSVRLYPASEGLQVLKPIEAINPLYTPLVRIKMTVDANQPIDRLLHLVRFKWTQKNTVLSREKTAPIVRTGDNIYECPLGDNKEWQLGGPVEGVGIALQNSPYYVDVQSIEGISMTECVPELLKVPGQSQFRFNAKNVRDASALLVLISEPNTVFDNLSDANALKKYRNLQVTAKEKTLASHEPSLTRKVQSWLHFLQTEGTFNIPPEVYNDGKTHQIVAVALDSTGNMIGLPSRILKVN